MQVKLSGPGTTDLMGALQGLLIAATEACQAYCMKSVKEMKQEDINLTALHQRKQKLESDVKRLEERKNALSKPQPPQQKQQEMKKGTRPLTPEEQAEHKAKAEAEHKARLEAKREAEKAEREAPLSHKPFAALADLEAKTKEAQQ